MAQRPNPINRRTTITSTQAVSDADRAGRAAGALTAFQTLTDPGAVLGAELRRTATAELRPAQAELKLYTSAKPKKDTKTGETFYMVGKTRVSEADFNTRRANAQADVDRINADLNRAGSFDPVAQLRGAFSEQFGMRDNLLGRLSGALNPTSEYNRMQDALGRGIQAQQADMERVQAQQTDEGTLGRSLMDEAQRKMAQGGQLSPEATRDAIQSARQGFASRGMATGSAALGAELLNRDRFSRQREFQNLGFAQSVEANDLARRTANTQLRQQAGLQNADAFNQLSQFNTLQRDNTNRFNIGLLGQSAGLADQERSRQIGVGQDQYNFAMGTDPRMMLAGLAPQNLTGATQGGLSLSTFNKNMEASNYNTLMNNNASMYAANAAKPQWWETAIGVAGKLL
jgi:hypothetical protein